MMYGDRMFGSYQEALRELKLVPTKGTEPSADEGKLTAGGPWESRKAMRGSPGGAAIVPVARYSSKFWFSPLVNRSCVIKPKLPRKTSFGLMVQARPMRGWKLFQSRLPS